MPAIMSRGGRGPAAQRANSAVQGSPPDAGRARPPGPAPRPISRSPSRTASDATARAARAASSGEARARGAPRARSECVQPRPVRGAVGMALAGHAASIVVAVEEHVGRLVAVAAGDDDVLGPERVQRPRELDVVLAPARSPSPRARLARPASTRASGRFGRDHRGQRQQQLDRSRRGPSSSSSTAPDSATITGSITTGTPSASSSSASRTAATVSARAEHADLHGVDADVLGDRPDLLDDELARAPGGRPSRRRCSARSAP